MTRFVIYWIGVGFFLDLAVYFARFVRHNESHDEFHGALMFLTFASSFGMDLWYVVREKSRLFAGKQDADVHFVLLCVANFMGLCQISRRS